MSRFYQFGDFQIDRENRLLLRGGTMVPLPPKTFDVLLLLAERNGDVVEKRELMEKIWPDTFVEEANVAYHISALRKVLGEGPDGRPYIETFPRRGYRFMANYMGAGEVEPASVQPTEVGRKSRLARTVSRHSGLTALVVSAVAGGLAVAGFFLWRTLSSEPGAKGSPIRSIAVLPFKPLVATSSDQSLQMGMADTLINRLSRVGSIAVQPFSAVRKYAELERDAVSAGQELGVESVLEGNIQIAGDRIRVTIRLISVRDGATLWADKYDQTLGDIFGVQDSIAERVTDALALKLSSDQRQQLTRHHTEDAEAYQDYLRGRYYWNKRTPDGLKKALDHYSRAAERDRSYALAHTGVAEAYGVLGVYYAHPKEVFPKAREAATTALELDDTLAEARTVLGAIKLVYDWDWEGAAKELKRVIELKPDHAEAHQLYAWYLAAMGRLEEAAVEVKLAKQYDSLSLPINRDVGIILYWSRQYDQAIQEFREMLSMDSNFVQARLWLGHAYEQQRNYEAAIALLEKAAADSNRDPMTLASLGHCYALSGQANDARALIDEIQKQRAAGYVSPVNTALIYAGLGERSRAIEWLETSYEERSPALIFLRVDQRWDPLRGDRRFGDLLERLRLSGG